jgi:hypothetical protein
LLDCPGLVFPYAFVHKPTEAVHSTPLAHTDSTSSTDDDDIDTAARRDVDIEYTGIDSIDRQRAMQECCGVVPLSQVWRMSRDGSCVGCRLLWNDMCSCENHTPAFV